MVAQRYVPLGRLIRRERVRSLITLQIATAPHFHPRTEEIYFILEGSGLMQVGDEFRTVGPSDAIAIPPGSRHQITNNGKTVLRFLCCCAPGYENDDTVMATP